MRPRRHRALLAESLEARLLLTSGWQNPHVSLDSNDNGRVESADVLLLINRINRGDGGMLPAAAEPPPYLDPSGDGRLTAIDVLLVINTINGDQTPPEIEATLARDTAAGGATDDDGVTRDPEVAGRVTDRSGIDLLEVSLDGGTFTPVETMKDGRFRVMPNLRMDGSDDGPHRLSFRAIDAQDNERSNVDVVFQLDTTGPVPRVRLNDPVRHSPDTLVVHWSERVAVPSLNQFALDSSQLISASTFGQRATHLELGERLRDGDYVLRVVPGTEDLAGNAMADEALFPFTVEDPPSFSELSPAPGERHVNVTREIVARFDEPVDPATVTAASFQVLAAGERVAGRVVVSSTERFVTCL